ncbi:host specificity factor TipJ family phage tail protein [Ruegeria sp.]|uniref:host specificity factor TipJ family phage tail protein n=1 Tax=Ruegeria sp. TaxID=1879320 RepID=UPI003B5AF91C
MFSLTGGSNRARAYEPLPLVLGEHRLFPDLGARAFTEYVDFDQYLSQIFNWGLGDPDIDDLRIGDTPIEDFEGVELQWGDAAGRVSLVAGNVDTIAGATLDDTVWVSRVTSENTNRIQIDITGRLFRVEDDGDYVVHDVPLEIRFRRQASDPWTRRSTTLSWDQQEPYRVTFAYDLPQAGTWTVQVRRVSAPSDRERTYDELHWAALRSHQPDTARYAGQTRLAARIKASGQLNGALDRLSGRVRQRIPVPVPDRTRFGTERVYSSNPAAIYRAYARGWQTPDGTIAGIGLAASRIDDAALIRWYDVCAAQGYRCDTVVTSGTHDEILRMIAQCGHAAVSWHSGKLGVVVERAGTSPTGLVSPANVIKGTFRVEYAPGALADEIVVRYIEPEMDWQYNSVRRTRPGLVGPVRKTMTVTARGVTQRANAAIECNLQAARQHYHRRQLIWEMGREGRAFQRGDVVNITHSLIDGGQAGRVVGGGVDRITLDRAVSVGVDDWILVRLADGRLHQSRISAPPGTTGDVSEVVLASPMPIAPDLGGLEPQDAIWRIYDAALPPVRARIIGVRPLSDRRFRFTAIDETDAYHALATSDLSAPFPAARSRFPRVADVQFSARRVRVGRGEMIELRAALTVSGAWTGGVVRAGPSSSDLRVVDRLSGPADLVATWIIPPQTNQVVQIIPGTLDSPDGPVWTGQWTWDGGVRPPAPANFAVTVDDDRTRRFTFDMPAQPDVIGVQIRYSAVANADWDDAVELHSGLLTGSPFESLDPRRGTWHFLARAISSSGLMSDPARVTATLGYARDATVFWRGVWSSAQTYGLRDLVTHQGRTWLSISDANTNNTPADGSAHWQDIAAAVRWRGAWSGTTSYQVNDLVSHEGASWISTAPDNLGNTPSTTSAQWDLIARAGEDGVNANDGQGFEWRGAWATGRDYRANATIQDIVARNGRAYICTRTHASTSDNGPTGDEGGDNWDLLADQGKPGLDGDSFRWRGTWSRVTTYARQDTVAHDRRSWISVRDNNRGNTPSSTSSFWQLLADRGDKGDPGAGLTGRYVDQVRVTNKSTTRRRGDGSILERTEVLLNTVTPITWTVINSGAHGLRGTLQVNFIRTDYYRSGGDRDR